MWYNNLIGTKYSKIVYDSNSWVLFLDSVTIFMKAQFLVVLSSLDGDLKNELLSVLGAKFSKMAAIGSRRTWNDLLWGYFDKQKVNFD